MQHISKNQLLCISAPPLCTVFLSNLGVGYLSIDQLAANHGLAMTVSLARHGLMILRRGGAYCSPPSSSGPSRRGPISKATTPRQTRIDSFRRRVCRTRAGQKRLPGGTDESKDDSDKNDASEKQQQQRKQRFGFGFGNSKKAQDAAEDASSSSSFEGELTLDEGRATMQ